MDDNKCEKTFTVVKKENNTEVTAIRIPEGMIAEIEKIIEETKDYSYKPDFVISAMRYFLGWVREDLISGLDKIMDAGDTDIRAQASAIIADWQEDLSDEYQSRYTGTHKMILLRIPSGLKDRWESIGRLSSGIENLQDFLRLALTKYIRYVKEEQKADSLADDALRSRT